jgi:hypothetical protein
VQIADEAGALQPRYVDVVDGVRALVVGAGDAELDVAQRWSLTIARPASVSRRSTSDVVGLESPVSSRSPLRVRLPLSSRWPSAALSFMARSSLAEPEGRVITVHLLGRLTN